MARKFVFDSGRLNGGLNNAKDDTEIENNQFADVQNIVFDEKNRPEKRPPIISNSTSGEEWKTSITEAAATVPIETLYTYQKSSGAKYFIAYSGTTVAYSTDRNIWTSIGASFSTTYKMQFETFKDVLIMCNGIDPPYYWDGTLTAALKIGQVSLALGAAGSVTNGVHKFKVTYEDANDQVYSYDVTNEITVADNKVVNISYIPLGPDWAEDRKVWASTAGTTTYYNVNNTGTVAATTTTDTLEADDATLATYEAYATYAADAISITPPSARFPAVFDSRLFFAHGTAVPSNYYYSEIDSFEDFMPTNTQAINISDGEFITGFRAFKAANQLLCWKKKGLYGIFPSSDTYTYRSLSIQGCDFSDSIQEFNLSDEYGERDTMLFANKSGVWEWTGNTIRKVSETPKGSSIEKTWETAKQREMEFKKNIINTDANWNACVLPNSVNAVNNFAEVRDGTLSLDDGIFGFNDSEIDRDFKCWCWSNTDKAIYAIFADGALERIGKYTWDSANLDWDESVSDTFTATNTVKMKYDSNTDRIYGMTSGGVIWRSKAGCDVADFFAGNDKIFTTTSLTGTVRPPTDTIPYTFQWRDQFGTLQTTTVYFIGGVFNNLTDPTSTQGYALDKAYYFYVSHYTEVTNNGSVDVWYKSGTGIFVFPTNADGKLDKSGGTAWLAPGLYCLVGEFDKPWSASDIVYTKTGNIDFDIVRISGVDYLFYTNHENETFGEATLPAKVIKYINLATWGTAVTHPATDTSAEYGRAYMYYHTYGSALYFTISKTPETTQSSYVSKISDLTTVTNMLDTGATYDLRKLAYNGTTFVGSVLDNTTGTAYIWKATADTTVTSLTSVVDYDAITDTLYDTASYSIPMLANPDGNLFYYIADDYKIYEWNTTDDPVEIGLQAAQTSVDLFMIVNDIGTYVPTMLFIQYGSETDAYWRGVWGNYSLKGYWLKSDTNAIDAGANSAYFQSIEAAESRGDSDTIDYYVFTYPTAGDLTPHITNIFFKVNSGESPLDSRVQNDPGGGTLTLTLAGTKRYIHSYIVITYNVYESITSSGATTFSNAVPYVDNLVFNWIDIAGGTTIPKTQIASIVFDDKYFLAIVEPRPKDTNPNAELNNNVILVLDRLKRWTIWRGRGCYASSFCVFDNALYWGDCYTAGTAAVPVYSDYLFALGNKGDDGLADLDVSSSPAATTAIDAYCTTKNYTSLAQFDNGSRKKQPRRIYITSDKFISDGTYNLSFEYRKEESKYTDSDGTNIIGDDKWTSRTMSVADEKNTGKINSRIDFPNEQPGKRIQFRFRNNTINQDIGFIDFTLEGFILHGRS